MSHYFPGPWRAEGATIKAVTHGQWFKICRAYGLRFTREGNEANAHLIAAAPELLDALKAMLAAYAPLADDTAQRSGENALHSSVRAARAAIAKAEGA